VTQMNNRNPQNNSESQMKESLRTLRRMQGKFRPIPQEILQPNQIEEVTKILSSIDTNKHDQQLINKFLKNSKRLLAISMEQHNVLSESHQAVAATFTQYQYDTRALQTQFNDCQTTIKTLREQKATIINNFRQAALEVKEQMDQIEQITKIREKKIQNQKETISQLETKITKLKLIEKHHKRTNRNLQDQNHNLTTTLNNALKLDPKMLKEETVPKLCKALFDKQLLTNAIHYQEKLYASKENECRRLRQQAKEHYKQIGFLYHYIKDIYPTQPVEFQSFTDFLIFIDDSMNATNTIPNHLRSTPAA